MGRPAGSLNEKTKGRIDEYRRRIAAGLSEDQARDAMKLTEHEWKSLLTSHYRTATPENNAQFMFRFAVRQADRYRAVAATLSSLQGTRHPRAGEVDPDTGKPFPAWIKPPDADRLCRVVKTLADLDVQTLEVGLRLGIYREAPRRIEAGVELRSGDGAEGGEDDPRSLAERLISTMEEVGLRVLLPAPRNGR